jgi:hypothetical protein
MTQISDERSFLVLNGVHLKKMATPEEIASAAGVDSDFARRTLVGAAANGWALDVEGRFLLLPDGVSAVQDYYRAAYGDIRANEILVVWYDRFETINAQFIKQVTEWQHSDGEERIQSRLMKTVERLMGSIHEITPTIPRYVGYVRRFGESVSMVDRGDRDYVCKPTIDSVHNIWFEFHEDILTVLGRPRDA